MSSIIKLNRMRQGGIYHIDEYGCIHILYEYNVYARDINYPYAPTRPINMQHNYPNKYAVA